MKNIIQIFVWIGVLTFSILALCMSVKHLESIQAESNIRSGVITDKEIITTHTLTGDTDMRWIIYIEGEYEYNGEKKTGDTHYDVPEDTYLSYNIGDNFDITNYSVKTAAVSKGCELT